MRKLIFAGRHSVGFLEASAEMRQIREPPPERDLAHAAARLSRISQCLPTPVESLRQYQTPNGSVLRSKDVVRIPNTKSYGIGDGLNVDVRIR
jgi:hypothetical protein